MFFKIKTQIKDETSLYDRSLLWSVIILISFGVVMVTSASMSIYELNPFYYTKKELAHIILAFILMLITSYIPISTWQKLSIFILIVTIILLIAVLFLGITIKGASRWLPLGLFNFQPAELAKIALFFFNASYLQRKSKEVKTQFWGFIKPVLVMSILGFLLLKQPDLGTVIVLFAVTISILFITGAKFSQFMGIIGAGFIALLFLIILEPYRLTRITTFLSPWQDQTGAGYQLTNSLMAIGTGGLFGKGLGNSVSKLGYLPEMHTDFIFSIIAEELGYIGVLLILFLLFYLTYKALSIGYRSLVVGDLFSGYLASQIGICFGIQTSFNLGVVSGLLPTKGLTLPFISYGGSSLIIMCIAVTILMRIDFEYRRQHIQARTRVNK